MQVSRPATPPLSSPQLHCLVQLSDLHLREPGQSGPHGLDTAACLKRAVQQVLQLRQRPNAVLITGDLTENGSQQQYAHLRDLLAPLADIPVLLLAGNHDDPQQLRQSFAHHDYWEDGPFAHYATEMAGVKIIALDTSVPGQSYGRLCAQRLQWLATHLETSQGQDVVLAMHHPPFCTGITYMDDMGLLEGRQGLHDVLKHYPNVKRVLCGHVHRNVQALFAGVLSMCAPSVAHQVVLDLRAHAPGQWTMEPAAGMLHVWGATPDWTSHSLILGNYGDTYDF